MLLYPLSAKENFITPKTRAEGTVRTHRTSRQNHPQRIFNDPQTSGTNHISQRWKCPQMKKCGDIAASAFFQAIILGEFMKKICCFFLRSYLNRELCFSRMRDMWFLRRLCDDFKKTRRKINQTETAKARCRAALHASARCRTAKEFPFTKN